MNRKEKAAEYFISGFNCAQSVLAVFKDIIDVPEEQLLKLSCGFGAGMGRMQNTCGAVTGAFMVIGSRYGKSRADDQESAEKTYSMVRQFIEEFEKIHETIQCRELLGCSLLSEDGKKHFSENNLKEKICSRCVSDAVEIAEGMINER